MVDSISPIEIMWFQLAHGFQDILTVIQWKILLEAFHSVSVH